MTFCQPLCQTCEQKIVSSGSNNTIWDFNPFLYPTLYELRNAFDEFYKKYSIFSYESYNEEGYTYTQWYSYYISRNLYKFKGLKQQTYWLFQIMAGYDFFKKLVRLGRRDDPLHTTLHHFLKYLDNFTWYTSKMIELLQYNLQLEDEDGEGISGNEYLSRNLMNKEDLEKSNKITREYKLLEENMYKCPFFSDFTRCQRCNDFLNIYQQMLENKDKIKILSPIISDIIRKRQECLAIYMRYPNFSHSTKRHQYVIDLFYLLLA